MAIETMESFRELHLSSDDKTRFRENVSRARAALELCKKTFNENTLTKDEYDAAHADFKVLVQTPWEKKELIYIAPEFINGEPNPKLQRIKFALERGLPYHAFITEGYAITWPLLLRLYYGVRGYSISINQFHSMMKVSYWLAVGLKTECALLFEPKTGCFTQRGMDFIDAIADLISTAQGAELVSKLNSAPMGERSVQLIELDATCINICNITKIPDMIQMFAAINKIPIWSQEKTVERMHTSSLNMFGALMKANLWPYHPMILDNKMYLMLPSQTVLETLARVINPTRTVKYVRRLGPISADMMAAHSDKNERAGNLIAPGIGLDSDVGVYVVHHKVSPPALLVEHDDYHYLLDATISKAIYEQINQIPKVLRSHLQSDIKFSSEIDRCIERERNYQLSENDRFLELLKYIFSENPDAEKPDFIVRKSSLLLLVNMVLQPNCWPYLLKNKTKITELLLPHKHNIQFKVDEVESIIKSYYTEVNNDVGILAMLMLFHFYLQDEVLCKNILVSIKQKNFATKLIWKIAEDGGLIPTFICQGKSCSLDVIEKMHTQERSKLIAPLIRTIYNIPAKLEVNKAFKETILNNQGEMILDSDHKYVQFSMPSSALTAQVRKKVGLDRLRIIGPVVEQLDCLKKQIPDVIIEKDINNVEAFICTFPINKRNVVESIFRPESWEKTKQSVALIQRFFRGHRQRSHFLQSAQERKQRIRELKGQISEANEKELFPEVSSLANVAAFESDILKKEEKIIMGWSKRS